MPKRFSVLLVVSFLACCAAPSRGQELPPGEGKPVLRVEAGGPTSIVTGLAFSPDGQRLYAAGFDKVVRAWRWQAATKAFEPDAAGARRVPLGPGTAGVINALAVSPDGAWLAAGGAGVVRGGAGFRDVGKVWPAVGGLTPTMRQDEGLIFLFDTRKPDVRVLRGHSGPVAALAFAQPRAGRPPVLVSAARGWDGAAQDRAGEVRAWDAVSGKLLAELTGLPDPAGQLRPGLAVWHTGDGVRQLRVALAWGDQPPDAKKGSRGWLRVWDVDAADSPPVRVADGADNTALIPLPEPGRILNGGYADGQGRLQTWDASGPKPVPAGRVAFVPKEERAHYLPRALALLASCPCGPPDHVAAVVRRLKDGEQEDYLQVFPRGAAGVADPVANVRLWGWDDKPFTPVLAAAPNGRHLAVGGSPDHQVRVYAIDQLLAKDKKPPQVLRSVGVAARKVAFATKGEGKDARSGLLLSESAGGKGVNPFAKGALVFDFPGRALSADTKGWRPQAPKDADGWKAVAEGDGRRYTVTVTKGGAQVFQRPLPDDRWVTALAVLPPGPPLKVPLLVVAAVQHGEPLLEVFDLASKEQLRRFVGHVAPVRSLAFSADGRLLASAADDQTACVWSLTDLPQVYGRCGRLPGVAVRAGKGGGVVVARVEADSPLAGKLKPGEVVEAVVDAKKVEQAVKSPHEVYEAFWLARPGEVLTLRVGGRAVPVRVGQGIDERHALFCLFLTRPDAKGQREWVGWNPHGPYDASSGAMAGRLGWHSNTGDPKAPTTFATLDKYKEEYYRKDILDHLVRHGNLARALAALQEASVPRPAPLLTLEEADGKAAPAGGGRVLVRQRDVRLRLTLDNYLPHRDDVVEWRLDGAAPQPLGPADEAGGRTLDLKLPAQAGVYKVRATVRLRQPSGDVEPHEAELTVRYQPPGPLAEFRGGALEQVVKDAAFPFEVLVRPGAGAQDVRVNFRHLHDGKEVAGDTAVHALDPARPLKVERPVRLRPGDNLVELVAQNRTPLAGYEQDETVRHVVRVRYDPPPPPKKTRPPAVVVTTVVPLPAGAPAGPGQAVVPNEPVVVSAARVRLVGTITGEEKLETADWDLGPKTAARRLAGFDPAAAKLPIGQEIDLTPGRQVVRVTAKCPHSQPAEVTVTLVYRPAPPRVVVESPAPGAVVHDDGQKEPAEVVVQGRLLPDGDALRHKIPWTVKLLVGGEELPAPVKLAADHTFTAKVVLAPGFNELRAVAADPWGGEASSREVPVRWAPRPVVLGAVEHEVGKKPFARLVARVHSLLPLVEEAVKVQVNDDPRRPGRVTIRPAADGPKGRRWLVQVDDVPVEQGLNQVKLRLANLEAETDGWTAAAVRFDPPTPAKAQIVLLAPAANPSTITDPEVAVRFRVRSDSPLRRVAVTRGGKTLHALALAKPPAAAEGPFQHDFTTAPVLLDPGVTVLRIEAENDGGPQTDDFAVNLVVRPARVEFDKLEITGPRGGVVPPLEMTDGRQKFVSVTGPRAWLHGKVRWGHPNDPQLKQPLQVRAYVNGFQQLPAALGAAPTRPDGGLEPERPFKIKVQLGLPTDNRIEIRVPGLKEESGSRSEVLADCLAPEKGQHLHLVFVAPGERNEKQLVGRALAALRAQQRAGAPHLFTAPAFEQVTVHALTGHVELAEVFTRLRAVEAAVRRRADQDAVNDVVLVYYAGAESVESGDHLFWMSGTRAGPRLRENVLELGLVANRFFRTFTGAQVVLLDVAHKGPRLPALADGSAEWPRAWAGGHPFALLRHAWRDNPGGNDKGKLLQGLSEEAPRAGTLNDLSAALAARLRRLGVGNGASLYDPLLPPALQLRLQP